MTKTKKGGESPPQSYDYTSTARSNKRRAELLAAAKLNGFRNESEMLTYIKNQALLGVAVVNLGNA